MKVGIITIYDNDNYGNRLQNYAVQTKLKNIGCETVTIKNEPLMNNKEKNIFKFIFYYFKHKYRVLKAFIKINSKRRKMFNQFNNNLNISKKYYNTYNNNLKRKYDYFVVGSDQVWNPKFGRLTDVDLLKFANNSQKIAFSASFGIDILTEDMKENIRESLNEFKKISVREEVGKSIVEEITNRKDVEVLLDPTMLITAQEWGKVEKEPKCLKKDKKYILNYFLGDLSEERRNEINKVAKENNCEVINILDKNSPFYETGPSEFLYLEKNAFLICTDSFHSCVFAILYNRPFIVYDRQGKTVKMNSRIETLLSKFKLKNRYYTGKITTELLKCEYKEAYEILNKERIKAEKFLKQALEIENMS